MGVFIFIDMLKYISETISNISPRQRFFKRLLESLLVNQWNMRQALLDVGLSAKGGNYKRCHKLKKEYLGIV
jgi:hypothetical protein